MPKKQKPKPSSDSPIRFQVSAPAGSEVEKAIQSLLSDVPKPLRSGLNLGRVFRQVLEKNDAEIAAMIRKHAEEF